MLYYNVVQDTRDWKPAAEQRDSWDSSESRQEHKQKETVPLLLLFSFSHFIIV